MVDFRLKVKNEIQYMIFKKSKKNEIKPNTDLNQQYTDRKRGTNNNERHVSNMSFGKKK